MAAFTFVLSLLVYFESQDPNANIKNVYDGLWYTLITLTTVGYGDYFPVTLGGKITGISIVISSIGVLGYLIGKISNKISEYMTNQKLGLNGTSFENHFVIIGWNSLAHQIADEILKSKNKVGVVTNQKDDIDLIHEAYPEENLFALFADFQHYEGLNKINIEQASKVFVNFGDDTETLVYIINMQKRFPKLKFVVLLNSGELRETFHSIGVDYVISRNEIASKLVASYIFEPDVALFTEDLMSTSISSEDYDLLEFKVIDNNPYLDSDYMEAFIDIKSKYDGVLMGISRTEQGKIRLLKNPSKGTTIQKDDHLILMANGIKKQELEQAFQVIEGRI